MVAMSSSSGVVESNSTLGIGKDFSKAANILVIRSFGLERRFRRILGDESVLILDGARNRLTMLAPS